MGQTIGLHELTAAKDHWCAWCRDGIRRGERYKRWMYKDGGDVAFMAMHSVCWAAIERIRDVNRWPAYDDTLPCGRDDHAKGRGCDDCDSQHAAGVVLTGKVK